MITGALQVVGQFLNARLMAHRRKRIWRTGRWIGRIVAALAMDVVKFLGLSVIWFEFVITDRPIGCQSVSRAMGDKILFTQTKQRRAIHFGRTADKIMRSGLKWFVVLVIPSVF